MFERIRKAVGRGTECRTDGGTATETDAGGGATTSALHDGSSDTAPASPSGEDTAEEPRPVDIGQVFEVLTNRRRRDVLRYLAADGDPATIGELAERIAARECGKDVAQLTSQERKRVYIGLYQCHLPKMADVDAVAYERDRGTVERGQHFDLFREYLPAEEGVVGHRERGQQ